MKPVLVTAAAVCALIFSSKAFPSPLQHKSTQTPPRQGTPAEAETGTAASNGPIKSFQGPAGVEYFSLAIDPHPLIESYIKQYRQEQNLDWIGKALDRGRPYLAHISRRLDYYEAPRELMFLPVIESEFRYYAVSRSGAAGIWQFMVNSIYPDMRINRWVDDRRDFWKATDSAIKKLIYNYSRLGDWLLAIGAYNCGLGRMQRALAGREGAGFWELVDAGALPPETVRYVPKFLAAAAVCSYPGRNGLPVVWETAPEWELVQVPKPVDIRILAERSDVPLDILQAGNSELNYTVTPPDYPGYFLKVPAEYTDQISKTLEDPEIQLMKFYLYTVRQGDTLYALSRHYGVTVEMIQEYNPGIEPALLQIGTGLIIPALREVSPYDKNQPVGGLDVQDSPEGITIRVPGRRM